MILQTPPLDQIYEGEYELGNTTDVLVWMRQVDAGLTNSLSQNFVWLQVGNGGWWNADPKIWTHLSTN